MTSNRIKCVNCNSVFRDDELLIAPHPFLENEEICGCPFCREVEGFDLVCDAPGCQNTIAVGRTWPDGVYRNTCHQHRYSLEPTP